MTLFVRFLVGRPTKSLTKTTSLVAAALLALAACGDDESSESPTTAATSSPTSVPSTRAASTVPGTPAASTAPPTTTGPADLEGRTFVSTEVVGYELVEGSQITLRFEGDRLGADAGCNQLATTWSLETVTLVVGEVASTMMACEPAELMDQDTWLSSFLISEPVVDLAGDGLTLTAGQSVITLVDREVAQPDLELEGATWALESIVSGDAVSSVPVGVRPPTLTFTAGEVVVDTGCNTGRGSYELAGTDVTFGPIAITRIGCDEAATEVEAAVVGVLDGAVAVEIEADQLTLTKGDQGLVYRAS